MKKNIFAILFIAIFSLFTLNVHAESTFTVDSISVDSKSEGLVVGKPTKDNLTINANVQLHELGDFVKYKITIKNQDNTDYDILDVFDDNESDCVKTSYEYKDKISAKGTIDIYMLVRLDKKINDISLIDNDDIYGLDEMTVSIKLKDSENNDRIINIITNPKTGQSLNKYTYILLFIFLLIIPVIIIGIKKKILSKKLGLVFAILLSLGVILPTFASTSKDLDLKVEAIKVKVDTYTVNYADGQSKKYLSDMEQTLDLEEPSKEGYIFEGWSDTENGEVKFKNGDKLNRNSNLTLYAAYSTIKYSIKYNLNDGTVDNPTEYDIETDDITLNKPEKTGYTFTGWTGSNGDTPELEVTIPKGTTGDKEYTANYAINEYDVIFNEYSLSTKVSVKYKDKVTAITPKERTGYEFKYWSLEENGEEFNFDTLITDNTNLYAVYEVVDYEIKYNLDGGNVENPTKYNVLSDDITLEKPEKTGYTFTGWTGSNGDTPELEVTIPKGTTGDKEYTANYAINEYDVVFNDDGKKTTSKVEYNKKASEIESQGKKGYKFKHWSLTEDGDAYNFDTLITKDIELYAVYEVVTYTISYNLDGGEADNPTDYTILSDDITLTNPTKKGYTFTGWTGSNGEEPQKTVKIEKGSTGNKEYTANFTINKYEISYNLDGGEASNPTEYTVETDDITLANPTKKGYTFTGWTGSNGDEPQKTVKIEKGSTGDKEYTANFTINTYTISYNLDGGEASNQTEYTVESDDITLANPTKKGYTFKGWTGSNGDEPQKTVKIEKGSTGNKEYKANFTINTYEITYNLDGGEATNPTEYTVESDDITLNNPEKTGYTFKGWTGSNGDEPQKTVKIAKGSTGNRTYTANFEINVYDVVFNDEGEKTTTNVEYNKKAEKITPLGKKGYEFKHWSLTKNGEAYDFDTPITKNIELYAVYEIVTYSISYNLDGGSATNPTEYTVESDNITLVNPTKKGYTFTGWTGSNGEEPQETVTITKGSTGNKEYKANFTINTYTISYNLDGGEASNPTEYTVETDSITLNNPEKTGYTFTGWTGSNGEEPQKTVKIEKGSTGNKEFNAVFKINVYDVVFNDEGETTTTNVEYNKKAEAITPLGKKGYEFKHWSLSENGEAYDFNTPITKDIELYAVYEIVTYSITYNLDGGEASNPTEYTVETDSITLNNPEKTGYTFTGWTGSNGEEPQKTVKIEKGTIGNKTYTANYKINTYTISYNLDRGEATNPTEYNIKTDSITLNNPQKTGYTFIGWTGSNGDNPELEVTIPKGSTGNKEYTANYTLNIYTISYRLDSGYAENPTEYNVETDDITLVNPTKEGYTFTGWTGSNGDEPELEVTIPKGTIDDKEYVANYTINVYSVMFNDYNKNTKVDVEYKNKVTPISTPVRDGYTFKYWSLEENGQPFDFDTLITDDTNLYAVYEIVTYTITYNLYDGEATNPTEYTIESDDITLTNPTKEGYTFKGWTGTNIVIPEMEVTIPKGSFGNKEFNANYEINKYDVIFNDYSSNTKQSVNYKNKATAISPEGRVGYEFKHWSLEQNGEPFDFDTLITEDVNLYAVYEVINYSISYDLDGGTATNPTTYNVETNNITLAKPEKEGYTFIGWTGSNGNTPELEVTIPKGTIGNKEYTANYEITTYTIKYNLDDGEATNPTEYTIESDDITLTNPTKKGYTFTGWTGSNGDEADLEVTISKGTTGDLTFTANYSLNTYTIKYNLDGGEADNPTEYTVESDDITLENPEKVGHTFAGWTGSNGDEPQKTVTIERGTVGNKEYTAHYSINVYDVVFYDEGGPTTKNVEYNNKVEEISPHGIRGYEFKYWSLDEDGEPFDFDTPITDNTNLYAIYDLINYSITYDLGDGIANNPTSYTVESDSITLVAPVNEGHTFKGWTGSNGDTPKMEVTIPQGSIGNKEYTANYKINTYTIKYDDQGTITEETVNYKETAPIKDSIGKEYYEFKHWSLEEGGSAYDFTTPVKSSFTLYAVYELANYPITYNLYAGTANNPTSYTVETEDITLVNPERKGYEFIGWTGSNGDTPEMVVTIPKGSSGPKEFVAHYNIINYTIDYDLDEGNVYNPATYNVATPTFKLKKPTKAGHTFIGWTGSNGDTPELEVTITKGTIGPLQFVAHYSVNNYTVTFNDEGNVTQETVEYNQLIAPKDALGKENLVFVYWSLEQNGVPFDFNTPITDNITLYAVYREVTSFASLNPTGGTVFPTTIPTLVGEPYGQLPTPTRDDYEFLGWFTEEEGGQQVTAETIATNDQDHTLFAHWNLIHQSFEGSYTFNGESDVINTKIALFSKENASKDFEVRFTIDDMDITQDNQCVVFGANNENTDPYQGIVLRNRGTTSFIGQYLAIKSAAAEDRVNRDWTYTPGMTIIIKRENGIISISFDGGATFENDYDFNEFTDYTDVPAVFGGRLTYDSGNNEIYDRYFKGTLSNMSITLK